MRVGIAGTEIVIQRGPLDFDLKENKLSTERGERGRVSEGRGDTWEVPLAEEFGFE